MLEQNLKLIDYQITNLLCQFYQHKETSTNSNAKHKEGKHNKETSTSSASAATSQSIDLTQENSTINLSDDTPLAQAKGKRRSSSTLRGDKAMDSPGVTSGSAVRSDGRLIKTIKQEKPQE